MVKSPLAPQLGYNYQALFFWTKAIDMLISDHISIVKFESDDVKVVDDVIVKYKDNYRDEETGQQIDIDFFQLKYHMSQSDAFSSDNLINPNFVRNNESLIERLFSEYKKLKISNKNFRLIIVSSWVWASDDLLFSYIKTNGGFKQDFFVSTKKTIIEYKQKLMQLLKISDIQLLNEFLITLRFEYLNMQVLKNILNPLLYSAKLKPINYSISTNEYESLPWKLLRQNYTIYSKESMLIHLENEGLLIKEEQEKEVFFIQSYETIATKYLKASSHHLDLSTSFINLDSVDWTEIKNKLKSFILKIYGSDKEIHLLLQTRLSISLYLGYLVKDQQAGVNVIPTLSDLTPWPDSQNYTDDHWDINILNDQNTDNFEEIVILCSVTHNINQSSFEFLQKNVFLQNKACFSFACKNGCNSVTIADNKQAWSMANELAEEISRRCLSSNLKIHLFYAGPSALAYVIGKKLQLKAIELYLYEYNQQKGEYMQSINVRRGE
ncbi:MAG: hypothetical protein A2X64_05735 [Ignavibacteria bacterium GWF2_33_9]|nr:MAG: hypothetical protein A2X64_05735 [Ignavibacteria bacterium GWF2_33_9]